MQRSPMSISPSTAQTHTRVSDQSSVAFTEDTCVNIKVRLEGSSLRPAAAVRPADGRSRHVGRAGAGSSDSEQSQHLQRSQTRTRRGGAGLSPGLQMLRAKVSRVLRLNPPIYAALTRSRSGWGSVSATYRKLWGGRKPPLRRNSWRWSGWSSSQTRAKCNR